MVDCVKLNRLNNRKNDDIDYTESSGTCTSRNAEKSPDINQMFNELGLGDSNTENKSNDSNYQDSIMNTVKVPEVNELESDLIDSQGDVDISHFYSLTLIL